MTTPEHDFRRWLHTHYPHVSLRIRTIGFTDLVRGQGKFAFVKNVAGYEEWDAIAIEARQHGLILSEG